MFYESVRREAVEAMKEDCVGAKNLGSID